MGKNMHPIFVTELRATAEVLQPLTGSVKLSDKVWDGIRYTEAQEERKPEPYALAWFATLNSIAELVEGQDTPLTRKQLAYLNRTLFGGMGSLSDLAFDARTIGIAAGQINDRLNERREALFTALAALG
jgi:hypothetical protein